MEQRTKHALLSIPRTNRNSILPLVESKLLAVSEVIHLLNPRANAAPMHQPIMLCMSLKIYWSKK